MPPMPYLAPPCCTSHPPCRTSHLAAAPAPAPTGLHAYASHAVETQGYRLKDAPNPCGDAGVGAVAMQLQRLGCDLVVLGLRTREQGLVACPCGSRSSTVGCATVSEGRQDKVDWWWCQVRYNPTSSFHHLACMKYRKCLHRHCMRYEKCLHSRNT